MPEIREPLRRFFGEFDDPENPFQAHGWQWGCPPLNPSSELPQATSVSQWEPMLQEAIAKLVKTLAARRAERLEFETLTRDVESLEGRVQRLEQASSIIVPITTFEPEPFEVLQTIHVVVQPSDDEYIATFFDANVNAEGANQVEAVDNLKDVMLHQFEHLSDLPMKKLGPGLVRQLKVLRSFIKKRG